MATIRLAGSARSPTCMPGLSLSPRSAKCSFRFAPLERDLPAPASTHCVAPARWSMRSRNLEATFRSPNLKALLPNFQDGVTAPALPLRLPDAASEARSALLSLLGLSREPPGRSTGRTRCSTLQRHSELLNSSAAPLRGSHPSGS